MLIVFKIVVISIVFTILAHLILGISSLLIVELTRLRDWYFHRSNSKNYNKHRSRMANSKQQ